MVGIESIDYILPVLNVFTNDIAPLICYKEGHRLYADGNEIVEVNLGDRSSYVRREDLRRDPALNLYFAFQNGKVRGVSSYRSIVELVENYGFPQDVLLSALSPESKQPSDEKIRSSIIAERELRETTFGERLASELRI